MDQRERILRMIDATPELAHRVLFAKRHPNETPEFHADIIRLWNSPNQYEVIEAFRGSAKSTLGEEWSALNATMRRFNYGIILSDTYDRACARLGAIKNELENNDDFTAVLGDQVGGTWTEGKIVLKNGVCVEAFGAGMSLRGAKHNDDRPDFVLVDDLEEYEGVVDKEKAARSLFQWFLRVVMPALDPKHRIRFNGTPLFNACVLRSVAVLPGWQHHKFPIKYRDLQTGEWCATWPDRFPLAFVDNEEARYKAAGEHGIFMQEYMLEAEEKTLKPFDEKNTRIQVLPTGWMPTSAFLDPARTVNEATSARSGYAVWSWMGANLFVREAYGKFHKPSEQIAELFRINEVYKPIFIGVERDGLEEFILEPLRAEQVRRQTFLPIVAMKAPVNKIGFISSLQPYHAAHELILNEGFCNDLVAELKSFPQGYMDVVNALAYATRMRPGFPIYEDFNPTHIGTNLQLRGDVTPCVCLSGTQAVTAAALLQFHRGKITVHGAWLVERAPSDCLENLLLQIRMETRRNFSLTAPAEQFDKYGNTGIVGVCRRARLDIGRGATTALARGSLKSFLQNTVGGMPALVVDEKATLAVNALAGGYARDFSTGGIVSDLPVENAYKVLAEALEVFGAFLRASVSSGIDAEDKWAVDSRGRRHISLLRGSTR